MKNTFIGRLGGFTLIELLVVVLIVGILAAVAVPQYQTAVLKARFKQMDAVAGPIYEALKLAYLSTGSYPIDFEVLDISMPYPLQVLKTEAVHRYGYDWGYCHLRASFPGNVQCQVNKGVGNIGIEIFADGTKYCFTSSSFTEGHKVCRAETGKTSFAAGATASSYYEY